MCEINLEALQGIEDEAKKFDLTIVIISHQAQSAESLGDATRATGLNLKQYEMRLQQHPVKKLMLVYCANNLGFSYNTANDHTTALYWFQKSAEWWESMVSDGESVGPRPARHLKNHARCLVYIPDYKAAKAMFDEALPRLQTEQPLNWAMLA